MDAPLALELVASAAARLSPWAKTLLDVGCGAGNYTLKLLEKLPDLQVTLLDLSRPMLERALARVTPATRGTVEALQGDIREVEIGAGKFDVIVAAAVLHHLREESEWRAVFAKLHRALRPGGSLWISDLVEHQPGALQAYFWARYGEYLEGLKDRAYRDHVLAYVTREDSPRPVLFQLDLLRDLGFAGAEILHKNGCFAVFAAFKAP